MKTQCSAFVLTVLFKGPLLFSFVTGLAWALFRCFLLVKIENKNKSNNNKTGLLKVYSLVHIKDPGETYFLLKLISVEMKRKWPGYSLLLHNNVCWSRFSIHPMSIVFLLLHSHASMADHTGSIDCHNSFTCRTFTLRAVSIFFFIQSEDTVVRRRNNISLSLQ